MGDANTQAASELGDLSLRISPFGPFTKKLEEKGCIVEQLNVSELEWFKSQFGTYTIVEEDGNRWCEVRRNSS